MKNLTHEHQQSMRVKYELDEWNHWLQMKGRGFLILDARVVKISQIEKFLRYFAFSIISSLNILAFTCRFFIKFFS